MCAAIYELAETRDLDAVSVSEVARSAGVDRGSFYAHFADLTALLDAIGDELITEFETMAASFETSEMYLSARELSDLPSLYSLVSAHPGLYRQLLRGVRGTTFAHRLQDHREQGFIRAATLDGRKIDSAVPLAIRARFATAGALGLVMHQLSDPAVVDERYTLWAWDLLAELGLLRPQVKVTSPND